MRIGVSLPRLDDSVITPVMFGGSESGDQTEVFQRMAEDTSKTWNIPADTTWTIDGTVTVSRDIRITGLGTIRGAGQILIEGGQTRIADLASDVTLRSNALVFDSVEGIAPYDVLILYNPTDYSWSGHRDSYREGEMVRVHSISGNTVTIYGETASAYAAADIEVYRVDGVAVHIDGIKIAPDNTETIPILVRHGVDVSIENVRGVGGLNTIVRLDRCYNFAVRSTALTNSSPIEGNEYALGISNSQKGVIDASFCSATRHALHIGGGTGAGCVPTRDVRISNCILTNLASSGVGSSDMHGNTDNITYHNCILSCANMAGRNASYIDCTIYGRKTTDGYAIGGAEIVGGLFTIRGCKIISDGDGSANGYLYLAAIMGTGGREGLREDLNIEVDDLVLVAPNAINTSKIVHVINNSTTRKVNVRVGRVRVIKASAMLCVLYAVDEENANFLSDAMIVDGPIDAPFGTYLMYPHSSIASAPKRMMTQRVRETVTTVNGQGQVLGTSQSFRYPYPAIPDALSVVHTSVDGAAKSSWGGRQLAPFCVARTATSGRLAVSSISNWTSNEDVRLAGTFGIQEI